MAITIEMPIACSLSTMALEEAAQMMGGAKIADLHVYASLLLRRDARELQGEHGFELTLVPPAVLKSDYAWLVVHGFDSVWCASEF
jgi:hypothetical protein